VFLLKGIFGFSLGFLRKTAVHALRRVYPPPGLRPKIALSCLLRVADDVAACLLWYCNDELTISDVVAKGTPAGFAGRNPSHNSGPFCALLGVNSGT
jgi:hypothetical protein